MQQINVIVTPKAKQTISVTVNGVAMSVVNSDGSYSTTHYSGTPFIIPNITVTDSDGSTYSHPSVKDVVCTPPVGADVENSDGSYTQHVNNGATLVLPDTIIKNTEGTTILTQPSATSTGVISDSVVTNSDNTFSLNVPAETNPVLYDITHIDTDLTPVVLPAMTPMVCTPAEPSLGWVRQSDWLPLPSVSNSGGYFIGLCAVYDRNNDTSIVLTGAYNVKVYNQSVLVNEQNIASGVRWDYSLNYNDFAGTECSRGYRQAIVVITPQSGNLTSVTIESGSSAPQLNQWLDIELSGISFTSLAYGSNNYKCGLLERFKFIGSNNITNISYFGRTFSRIQVFDVNTSNCQDFSNLFIGCHTPMYDGYSLDYSNATNMDRMHFQDYSIIEWIDESVHNNNHTTNRMFYEATNLESVYFADASKITDTGLMFAFCANIKKCILTGITIGFVITGRMSSDALNDMFTALGTASGSQTITVTGNPGADTCDTSIATAKGFTVVT